MKRTTTATIIGAATAIALAACGSGGASEGDTVKLNSLSKDVNSAMEDAGSGTMKVKSTGVQLDGDFDLGKKEAASISGKTGGQDLDIRVVDGTHYLKAPSPQVTQKGKSWIKADPEAKNPQEKQLATSMQAMVDLRDPFASIKGAGDVDAKVTKVEDGKVTYEIKLSKKQMGKALEHQAKEAGNEQGAAMAAQQAQKTTTTLVVDEDERPVKATTKSGGASLDVTYSGWGDDVSVKAPAKDKVGTLKIPKQPSGGAAPGGGPSSSN